MISSSLIFSADWRGFGWLQGLKRVALGALAIGTAALFFAAPAHAEEDARAIVEAVNVEGNQRIEAATVRAYMVLKAGQRYSEEAANESLKTLFGTGLFSDVSIRLEGRTLFVRVEENALVNLVAFEGNSALQDDDIESLVLLRSRSVFSRRRTVRAVQTILRQYRRLGYYGVRVLPKIISLTQNRVNLVFEIDEGVRTNVRRIDVLGNAAYSDSGASPRDRDVGCGVVEDSFGDGHVRSGQASV